MALLHALTVVTVLGRMLKAVVVVGLIRWLSMVDFRCKVDITEKDKKDAILNRIL